MHVYFKIIPLVCYIDVYHQQTKLRCGFRIVI